MYVCKKNRFKKIARLSREMKVARLVCGIIVPSGTGTDQSPSDTHIMVGSTLWNTTIGNLHFNNFSSSCWVGSVGRQRPKQDGRAAVKTLDTCGIWIEDSVYVLKYLDCIAKSYEDETQTLHSTYFYRKDEDGWKQKDCCHL